MVAQAAIAGLALALALDAADRLTVPLGLDALVPAPEDNPITRDKVRLGRDLFFEKRLSLDGTVSCGTCHDPKRAFTDGKPLAEGVGGSKANRRSPPVMNRAYGLSFFWDGRARTLEEQVLQPILNPKEMAMKLPEVIARLEAHAVYRPRFQEIFGTSVNPDDLARALASYVRSILAGGSPYDRYVAGDRSALSPEEQAGLKLFRGKANCVSCHVGPNLSDERFHNTGTAWLNGRWLDPGRVTVTNDEADRGAFKTPSLREVEKAAPYMHDGSLATLEDVIDFYDKGGRENPMLDGEIRPLKLTPEEKKALLALLRSLSGMIQEGWPE